MASEDDKAGREDEAPLGIIERLLAPFADVKAGEGLACILMFLNVSMILMAYYVLKTVREGLILGGGGIWGLSGAEVKSYAAGVMAILLVPIVSGYGVLASKVGRMKLINGCVLAVIACLGGFFVLGQAKVNVGIAFFLWLGIVNVFLIAQFWSYANDIYTPEQGKRLFAIIAIGGSLGAIVGPKIASLGKEHTYLLMVGAGGILGLCLVIYNAVNRMQGRAAAAAKDGGEGDAGGDDEEEPLGKEGGFELLLKQRYLLFIALMVLVANLVNTTGEYVLGNAAETHAAEVVPDPSAQIMAMPEEAPERVAALKEVKAKRAKVATGFYGDFFFYVNLAGFIIQAFLVSRIFKYVGVRVALFVLPVIALGGYALIGLVGGLSLLKVAKTAENSTDYSLQNTVRQALFLPTSREAKYKAKAAIDTFFVRTGDFVSSLIVGLGIHGLGLSGRGFALANVGLVSVWLLLCVGIAREHRRLSADDDEDAAASEA